MYHRAGFMLGAKIAEQEFEKGLAFCGTGMGIHLAAGRCPGVLAAVAESVPAAKRCTTGNNCNVLAMGAFFTGPRLGMAMADAFLEHSFNEGYEEWEGFDRYHIVGNEETLDFDYEAYKANGFKLADETVPPLGPPPQGLAF
jgi:ribose 5-phosphate isomerase B